MTNDFYLVDLVFSPTIFEQDYYEIKLNNIKKIRQNEKSTDCSGL